MFAEYVYSDSNIQSDRMKCRMSNASLHFLCSLCILCAFTVKVSEFGSKLRFTNWKITGLEGDWSFTVTFYRVSYLFNYLISGIYFQML